MYNLITIQYQSIVTTGPCTFYITEWSNTTTGGYISRVDSDGIVTRLTQSGAAAETGVVVDDDILFYTTYEQDSAWMISLTNLTATPTKIWTGRDVVGLGIARVDKLLFVDDSGSPDDYIYMLNYTGSQVDRLQITTNIGEVYGFAADESQRFDCIVCFLL